MIFIKIGRLLRQNLNKLITFANAKQNLLGCSPMNPLLTKPKAFHTLVGKPYLFLFPLLGWLSSCSPGSDPTPALEVPAAYDTTAYTANTQTERAITQRLAKLLDLAKAGNDISKTVSLDSLRAAYYAGSPSLSSLTYSYTDTSLSADSGWFWQLAKASGQTYMPGAPTAGAVGGVYGGYLFNKYGIQPAEIIEKLALTNALYYQCVKLMGSKRTLQTSDKVLTLLGVSPDFVNSDDALKHRRPDAWIAEYLAKRDKNDGKGFYSAMRYALTKLQAAQKAGDSYGYDQGDAVIRVESICEAVEMATIVYYTNKVISNLSATNPTDAQKAEALHAHSEALGFLLGLYLLPQQFRVIDDSSLELLLTQFQLPVGQAPRAYTLVTDPTNTLPTLSVALTNIKNLYGFSDAQMDDFKQNWVSVQGR